MASLEKYLERLRAMRKQHAWEVANKPQIGSRPAGEAYMYAVGFASGLDQAEKLVAEVLEEDKKDTLE
jgi:hypothetical protein